jgi:tRNA(fMet)-specific endonuclease VapC
MCIYIGRQRPQTVLDRFKVLPPGSTAISVVTYGELVYEVQKSPDSRKAFRIVDELPALISVIPRATNVATIYGAIRSNLAARGELIGNNDLWIAAHAKSLGLTLVTNNEREFQRVEMRLTLVPPSLLDE